MGQRQKGNVISIENNGQALVQIHRQGSCSAGKCSHGQMLGPTSTELSISAKNAIGAKAGDWVEVEFDGSLALKAAFGIYILPLVLGLLAYVAGTSVLPTSESWWVGIASALLIALTFTFNLRYFAARSFDYKVVAYADDEVLPVAPACQGCKFLSQDSLKLQG